MSKRITKIRIFPEIKKEYYAGSDGKVYNNTKALKERKGIIYLRINDKEEFFYLDKLIAGAFLKNEKNLPFLYHKNNDVYDSRPENLEYVNNEMIMYKEDDEWKNLKGYNNQYQISINGKVRSHNRFVPQLNKPNAYTFKPGKELKLLGRKTKYVLLAYKKEYERKRIKDLLEEIKGK